MAEIVSRDQVLYLLASVPSYAFKRWLCVALQRLDKNFPPIESPSEEMVRRRVTLSCSNIVDCLVCSIRNSMQVTLALEILKSVLFLDHSPRVEKVCGIFGSGRGAHVQGVGRCTEQLCLC